MTPYLVKLPEYLSSTSFQNPGTEEKNLFQYTMNTEMNYFDWLHTQPRDLEIFSAAMQASSQRSQGAAAKLVSSQFPLSDVLNCDTNKSEELEKENVLIVDVGGGRGKVLNDLRIARPDLQGGMIVQDLPKEIDGREPTPGIKSMAHDFFTPQPIKGMWRPNTALYLYKISDLQKRSAHLFLPPHFPRLARQCLHQNSPTNYFRYEERIFANTDCRFNLARYGCFCIWISS